MNWKHKDLWQQRGTDFLVEVSRHEEEPYFENGLNENRGIHRWCVYGYIYPKHPHFAAFDGTEKSFQPACENIPMHGGLFAVSYLRYHRDHEGDVCSIQVGADYNHLHDERFTHYATADMAQEVFQDAEQLFAWLTECKTPELAVAQ